MIDETTTDAEIGFGLGMPRDLDGDDAADNLDCSDTAIILPVLIEVQWGAGGERSFRVPVVVF